MGTPIIGTDIEAVTRYRSNVNERATMLVSGARTEGRAMAAASRPPNYAQLVNNPLPKNELPLGSPSPVVEDYSGIFSRVGYIKRHVIRWEIPQVDALISMYINPNRLELQSQKHITEQRVKGGFMLQYWGELLDTMSLTGTTGSGGVEGVLILRDIYRSEQHRIEMLRRDFDRTLRAEMGRSLTTAEVSTLATIDLERGPSPRQFGRLGRLTSTLAQQAVSVTMHYQGASYRGYFMSMTITESTERLGLFDYAIQFKIVSTIGMRKNFMPWHRNPRYDISESPLSWEGEARRSAEIVAGQRMRPRTRYLHDFGPRKQDKDWMEVAKGIAKKGLKFYGYYRFGKSFFDIGQERGALSAANEALGRLKFGPLPTGRLRRGVLPVSLGLL